MTGSRPGYVQWVRRPWAWVLFGVLVLATFAAVLRYAPLFSVENIAVAGNEQVTSDAVVAAASVPDGTRMLTAPLDEIANRVESLDAVASARVTRDWPNGLKIVVRERRPVGYVALDDGFGLVGSDGSVYSEEEKAPTDLPRLPDAAVGAIGDPYESRLDAASVHAFEVATMLPRKLQKSVAEVATASDDMVVVTTDDGVVVRWGSSESSTTKARVVALLMKRPGWGTQFTDVDVSAPNAPALN
ncbi:MAG: cell division protein FtsQ/DivIB [Actinomycetes bacterium]